MNSYLIAKNLHMTSVVLSVGLFLLRGYGVFRNLGWVKAPLLRLLPHMIDTVLLGSAIWLMVMLGQYPLQQPWLTAKVVGLLVYIGLGTVALKGKKAWAFVLSLVVVGYIIAVALTRNPTPFA